MDLMLTGATVFNGNNFSPSDVFIQGGIVSKIAPPGLSSCCKDSLIKKVKSNNLHIIPAFVDVHVHLREPGFSYKETIRTGTLAAVHAGYTAVCAMPNLSPPPDSLQNLAVQTDIIAHDAIIKVFPYASITKGQRGEGQLVDFGELKDRVIAFSDDGRGVQSEELMEKAMRQAARHNVIIAAHCEDNSIAKDGYIHAGSYAAAHGHRGIPSESEYAHIARDLALAAKTGCRYHVCHVSAANSVAIIRKAKAAGVSVTCETAPHYLVFNDNDLCDNGRFKMNPPIRGERDREALIEGIVDGTIDIIATDHAPHSAEEKSRGLAGSLMGIVGLETAFPVLYTFLVKKGIITLERLINLMCSMPRRIFGIRGGLSVGEEADIAVLDLSAEYTIDSEIFASKGKSSPFDGLQVCGRNLMTICKGEIAYEFENIV